MQKNINIYISKMYIYIYIYISYVQILCHFYIRDLGILGFWHPWGSWDHPLLIPSDTHTLQLRLLYSSFLKRHFKEKFSPPLCSFFVQMLYVVISISRTISCEKSHFLLGCLSTEFKNGDFPWLMYFLYKNECRLFKPVKIIIGRGLMWKGEK
jgi:hypothetical protein